MIPVIVLRPEPGCAATLATARAQGLDARGFPLFAVVPCAWQSPPPDSFDALLIGSANAPRHAGPALAAYRGKPAYTVGAQSARAAQAAGLDVVAVGEGGLQAVLERLRPGDLRLLRLAGAARVALAVPPGVTIDEQIVYASEPLPFSPSLATLLREPAVVLLHSAEAAWHFAHQCDHHVIGRTGLALAAIGPRVAAAAGGGWDRLEVAAAPNDPALLALAAELCQASDGLHNRHGR